MSLSPVAPVPQFPNWPDVDTVDITWMAIDTLLEELTTHRVDELVPCCPALNSRIS